MKARRLYLVRHGALARAACHRYIGQTDLPLSDEGVAQAHALKARFDQLCVEGVYCSDLLRSVLTAEIIACPRDIPVYVRPQLREICLGSWEGLDHGDVARLYPGQFAARGKDFANFRPPEGESFSDCFMRVHACLHDIMASSTGDILIVGHAAVNRMILCDVLAIPVTNLFRLGQDYGCLNIIDFGTREPRVTLLNSSVPGVEAIQERGMKEGQYACELSGQ